MSFTSDNYWVFINIYSPLNSTRRRSYLIFVFERYRITRVDDVTHVRNVFEQKTKEEENRAVFSPAVDIVDFDKRNANSDPSEIHFGKRYVCKITRSCSATLFPPVITVLVRVISDARRQRICRRRQHGTKSETSVFAADKYHLKHHDKTFVWPVVRPTIAKQSTVRVVFRTRDYALYSSVYRTGHKCADPRG